MKKTTALSIDLPQHRLCWPEVDSVPAGSLLRGRPAQAAESRDYLILSQPDPLLLAVKSMFTCGVDTVVQVGDIT